MSLRWGSLLLIAVLLASEVGCCCGPIARRSWFGCQCGEVWWNEWFSHPPDCCDPCNNCGQFVGSRNPYVHSGPSPSSRGVVSSEGFGRGPTQAQPPGAPYGTERFEPTPAEELPMPGPSAAVYRDELGQTTSYHRPVDSPRTSRKLGHPRRPARYVQ